MTENLKRCPFCGEEAKCIEFYGMYHVICCDCHIAGRDASTREKAIEVWNTRPIEDELDKENKRLREALEKIIDRAENEESKASNATYGFAYDIEYIARDALKGGEE